jgi:cytochrome c oxidase assembly protein subunit 15
METSLPRVRGISLPARTFRGIAVANAVMLVVIVATGATVRLTASGLGCRHWPGCQPGDPLPEKGYHSYIEFSNRMIAALTIAVTLLTYVAARFTPSLNPWVRRLALATFVGTLAQAPLGAITVYYDLNPWLVLSHFLLSLLIITAGVSIVLLAFDVAGERLPGALRALGLVVGLAALVLIVTGTFATAGGPHPGSIDVRRLTIFGSFGKQVYWHVRATAVFGLSLAALTAWLAVRRSRFLRFALVILGVLCVQMAVGEIQYRTVLPWWLVLCHVTLAASLWGATAALVLALWRPSRMAR